MRNIYNPESGFAYKHMLPESNDEFTALWGAKLVNNLYSCRGLIGTFEIPPSVYDAFIWKFYPAYTDAHSINQWIIPLDLQNIFYFSPQVQLFSRFASGTVKLMGAFESRMGTPNYTSVFPVRYSEEEVSGTVSKNALTINHRIYVYLVYLPMVERMTHIYYKVYGL